MAVLMACSNVVRCDVQRVLRRSDVGRDGIVGVGAQGLGLLDGRNAVVHLGGEVGADVTRRFRNGCIRADGGSGRIFARNGNDTGVVNGAWLEAFHGHLVFQHLHVIDHLHAEVGSEPILHV